MSEFNESYIGIRKDVLELVPTRVKTVLDVGCSNGALGEQIKKEFKARVEGIDFDKNMSKVAAKKLDKVIIADLENIDLKKNFKAGQFDCIIFADILEHLTDPWKTLSEFTDILKDKGVIIISYPNVRHISSLFSVIVGGYWPYRDRGIHDRTHLRFFTLKNLKQMFQSADLRVKKIQRNYRIFDQPARINRATKFLALPILKEFLAYQYVISLEKNI